VIDGGEEACLPELGHGLYRKCCWEGEKPESYCTIRG
jgi:hypothetical protein